MAESAYVSFGRAAETREIRHIQKRPPGLAALLVPLRALPLCLFCLPAVLEPYIESPLSAPVVVHPFQPPAAEDAHLRPTAAHISQTPVSIDIATPHHNRTRWRPSGETAGSQASFPSSNGSMRCRPVPGGGRLQR